MKEDPKNGTKQSFIAEARREQIIEAAIQTLDEIGYVKASLSQIAERAGISTGLISYHFSDKSDLMNHLFMKLLERSTSYVLEQVHQEHPPWEKLRTFIESSLAYQSTYPARSIALLEIIFNARTPDNIPYYKLGDGEEDQLLLELKHILREGQEKDDFGTFHIDVMANLIQGAIGEYMFTVDLKTYGYELVKIIGQVIKVTTEQS